MEQEIWIQFKNGNRDAILSLYNAHYLGLMNYGLKLTGDRDLTNDCITQILLRLWEKRDKLPLVENARSYLLTCLRRELFAVLKSNINHTEKCLSMQKDCDQAEPSYEDYIIQLQTDKILHQKVAKAIGKLTERERELLRMKFFEDMGYDEIAAHCCISKRTAYNIIYTSLKLLRADFTMDLNSSDPISLLHSL